MELDLELDGLISKAAENLGYSQLKKEQREVIGHFISGKDVFAVLPTGFGKSLCYACLPFIFNVMDPTSKGTVILVITPLTSIMKDQVQSLKAKGLAVGCICGDDSEDLDMKVDAENGKFELLYFTPESLLMKRKWRHVILSENYQRRLKGLVIDEAHTLIKWGTTFREALLKIGDVRSFVPSHNNIMALTATAPQTLRMELSNLIGMKNQVSIILPPCKDNLFYSLSHFDSLESNFSEMLHQIKKERELFPRTIIYCRTMEDCSNLYLFFWKNLGKDFTQPSGAPATLSRFRLVDMFNSCTDLKVKEQIISSFTKPDGILRIVCATVAFGMGVDCPDVRLVVHLGPPDDLESYIQETGRAGRDQKQAKALLLVKRRCGHHINDDMKKYCLTTSECRRHSLFKNMEGYSRQRHTRPPKECCDICCAWHK